MQPPTAMSAPQTMAHTSATSYQVLYRFAEAPDATTPEAGLTAVNGTLYGTTTAGGVGAGTVFSVTTGGVEHVLHEFGLPGDHDGRVPMAGLTAVRGVLYGTTEFGRRGGTVFKMSTTGENERVLHAFLPPGGRNPTAALIDVDGTLYGTTNDGGPSNAGTVFAITTHGTSHRVYAFTGGTGGEFPSAPLVDVNGVLYGTTFFGGTHNHGTVFSVTPSGKERVVYSFAGSPDGADPSAGLIDVDGTLYGTTSFGGAGGDGTIYSITPAGRESVLHSFAGAPDGSLPYAGLVAVHDTLYGTTTQGGTGSTFVGLGTVFSININGKNERVLHSFAGTPDGEEPYGSLIDVNGTLYGTTYAGGNSACGNGCGTVFALRP